MGIALDPNDLRDQLLEENNNLVVSAYKLKDELEILETQEITPEMTTNIESCNKQLSEISKQLEESNVSEKIKEVREKIEILETEVLGQPLSNSPHIRKGRPH